jgi:hypothetical protein
MSHSKFKESRLKEFLHKEYCDRGGTRLCEYCQETLTYRGAGMGYNSVCTRKLLEAFIDMEAKVKEMESLVSMHRPYI